MSVSNDLSKLTHQEIKQTLVKAAFRGYHVNSLASSLKKHGTNKLVYDAIENKISFQANNGKLKNTVKLDKIIDAKFSFSITRFFKKLCGFDKSAYEANMDPIAQAIYDKIQENLPSKQENLSSKNEKFLNPYDLILMKKVLGDQGMDVVIVEKGTGEPKALLNVKYDENINAITILDQNKDTLWFQMDKNHKIISCTVNGVVTPLENIPDEKKSWLNDCFKEVIDKSSSYKFNDKIEIEVIKRVIQKNPEGHLNKLTTIIKEAYISKKHPRMNIVLLNVLLNGRLIKSKGMDNGGISRDYLNSLFSSLVEQAPLSFKVQKRSKLFLPVASTPISSDNLFPSLSDMEKRICKEIGNVMMFCYRSKPNTEDMKNNSYLMGQHFDSILFEMALTLSNDELDKSFETLDDAVKFRIAKQIMATFLNDAKDKKAKDKLKLFSFAIANIDDYDPEVLAEFGGEDFLTEDCKFNKDEAKANPKKFIANIRENLLKEKFGDSKNGTSVGELVSSIHAVAQGLREYHKSEWQSIQTVKATDFNDKIQGVLDRNAIVKAMKVNTQMLDSSGNQVSKSQADINELNKKTKWLENWILNPKTQDSEIRQFLIFISGCNSLPKGQKIEIESQVQCEGKGIHYSPIPMGGTCHFRISLSPKTIDQDFISDKTEKEFLKIIDEYIVKDNSHSINMD